MTVSVINREKMEQRFEPSLLLTLTEQILGLFTTQSMVADGVEVVRGPASVPYGSNAIVGVVNIFIRSKNLLAQRYEINDCYPMAKATFMGGININF